MFFEGKLKLIHLRLLYENITHRKPIDMILSSGILDVPYESDEERDILLEKCHKLFQVFKFQIDSHALPCEKKYFNERGYKSGEFRKDLKIHLRVFPTATPIETVLDFKGFSGSHILRYIVNRIVKRPLKDELQEDEFPPELSASSLIAEIDSILYNTNSEEFDIDQEIEQLKREYNYRAKLVSDVLNSKTKDLTLINQSKEALCLELKEKLAQVDNTLSATLKRFELAIEKRLQQERTSVRELIEQHRITQENSLFGLKTLEENIASEIDLIVSEVKELKPFSSFELSKLSGQLNLLQEVFKMSIADREDFVEVVQDVEAVAKDLRTISSFLNKASFKGVEVRKVSNYLTEISNALKNRIEEYESFYKTLNTSLADSTKELSSVINNLNKVIAEGSDAHLQNNRRLSTVIQNLNQGGFYGELS